MCGLGMEGVGVKCGLVEGGYVGERCGLGMEGVGVKCGLVEGGGVGEMCGLGMEGRCGRDVWLGNGRGWE